MLVNLSKPGDTVYDPFCGSGVVPLESLLLGRRCVANDISPYAHLLTEAKLKAPATPQEAIIRLSAVSLRAEKVVDVPEDPDWVKAFFHPGTLMEVHKYVQACKALDEPFLLACLMGILHHQRPGFLSYPSSNVTPYLRSNMFPISEHPDLYTYRSVLPRLVAKVGRTYKRPAETSWSKQDYKLLCEDAREVKLKIASIDLVLTSPPYYKALDYARDNRLRLYFLGTEHKPLEDKMIAKASTYIADSCKAVNAMLPSLKIGGYMALIVGDVDGRGVFRRKASDFANSIAESADGELKLIRIISDEIPPERRSRRHGGATKVEHVIVFGRK